MNLNEKIQEFQNKNKEILTKAKTSEHFPKEEIVSFGGVNLHEDMDFSLFSDEEILLNHSVIHTIFNTTKMDKGRIGSIHSEIVEQMNFRGKKHENFDYLDKI